MNEIDSDKITKGLRTYFFDIKKSRKGNLYLNISEKKKTENGFEHHRIMVFDEDLNDFIETLKKSLQKFEKHKKAQKNKTYSVEKIRETYKRAYLPWIKEDDNRLELLFYQGKKIEELALIFERNEGAINARIKKLKLK